MIIANKMTCAQCRQNDMPCSEGGPARPQQQQQRGHRQPRSLKDPLRVQWLAGGVNHVHLNRSSLGRPLERPDQSSTGHRQWPAADQLAGPHGFRSPSVRDPRFWRCHQNLPRDSGHCRMSRQMPTDHGSRRPDRTSGSGGSGWASVVPPP